MPEVPLVAGKPWQGNPIDAFLLAELEQVGLEPLPEVDRLSLSRRLSFDLTGLPPRVEEQAEFLADDSPQAYERLVDRLLASTAYGERWAQSWLDLVRYAETDGFKADGHRPNAYKYRDFVIESLNSDLPYDRFVAWQLAGDELEPTNPSAIVATGLNRLYPDEYNAANLEQRRQEILDDITETTGLAFLGLTMGCARCHDHKFDEITQVDYFRLQAFFAPLVARDDLTTATAEEVESYTKAYREWSDATRSVREAMEALIGPRIADSRRDALLKFREEIQRCVRRPEGERSPFEKQIAAMAMKQAVEKDAQVLGKLSTEEKERYEKLRAELEACSAKRPLDLPGVMAASDVAEVAPPTFVLDVGNWRKPGVEVQPGFPLFLGAADVDIQPPSKSREPEAESPAREDFATGSYPTDAADDPRIAAPAVTGRAPTGSTGRRSALVRWLTRPDHPLVARVIANRIWQGHFGVGIVATANDFGVQGAKPTHPKLLDWLAAELTQNGFSLKRLHRAIVTSDAYRRSSIFDPGAPQVAKATRADPQNHFYWRANRRRLEGESLRDSLLAISGQLSRRAYGPSARPELPPGLSPSSAWRPDENPLDRQRRSIYVLAKRNLRYPMFDAFDMPDMHHSCPRRETTTTAPQALMLINGELALSCAQEWSRRLLAEFPADDSGLVERAYREALGRPPVADETLAALAFLSAGESESNANANVGSDGARAVAVFDFCHALMNSNELVYVD